MMMTKEKRLIQHNFKTTEAEDAMIQQKMKTLGITNQSAYLRAMVLNGYILKLDLRQIQELIRMVKHLSNNVNQIAKRLNANGSIYETEVDEILEGQKEIWATLNQMLTTLGNQDK